MRAPTEVRKDLVRIPTQAAAKSLEIEMLLDIRDILQGLTSELHDLRLAVQYLKKGS